MGWFDKLTGKAEPLPIVAEAAPLDPARLMTEPDDGIHHEYFVNDEPVDGRYQWLCRVYGLAGAVYTDSGATETQEQAASAARSWAAEKKRELRGIA